MVDYRCPKCGYTISKISEALRYPCPFCGTIMVKEEGGYGAVPQGVPLDKYSLYRRLEEFFASARTDEQMATREYEEMSRVAEDLGLKDVAEALHRVSVQEAEHYNTIISLKLKLVGWRDRLKEVRF